MAKAEGAPPIKKDNLEFFTDVNLPTRDDLELVVDDNISPFPNPENTLDDIGSLPEHNLSMIDENELDVSSSSDGANGDSAVEDTDSTVDTDVEDTDSPVDSDVEDTDSLVDSVFRRELEKNRRLLRLAMNPLLMTLKPFLFIRQDQGASAQIIYIAKEDASSPTISLDSLTALLTIFAVENRHVAVADVSGAYLHVDMDEGGYHSHRKTFWINVQSYGSKHSFLGMNIEFPGDGTVTIDTNNYFREVIEDFQREGHVIVGTNATPAAPNIFNTTRKNTPRSVEIADIFRSTVAKLLWASQRSRLDLSFAVTFLCSRLNCATEGDWEKLRKILGYLKGTIHMKRKLSGFNLHTMYTWVDASYAVHPDMRSHTGGALSFGVGALN